MREMLRIKRSVQATYNTQVRSCIVCWIGRCLTPFYLNFIRLIWCQLKCWLQLKMLKLLQSFRIAWKCWILKLNRANKRSVAFYEWLQKLLLLFKGKTKLELNYCHSRKYCVWSKYILLGIFWGCKNSFGFLEISIILKDSFIIFSSFDLSNLLLLIMRK